MECAYARPSAMTFLSQLRCRFQPLLLQRCRISDGACRPEPWPRLHERWAPRCSGLSSQCRAASVTTSESQARSVSEGPSAVSPPVAENGATARQGPTFQDAIRRLQDYWAKFGCAICLPHNTEVGAGTMNPATYLRVSGPEPWNVCYVEPSIRPDDSRYGENPNRLQRHTQLQVILKPDPGNPQELYLGSLEALGIDTRSHDVRFVEDNWESPALGAWGLGWEVWLDGMEVTQFTYFQQAGGRPLSDPAVEITYGLERILMSLQGVNHFKDIRYTDSVTYGEMFLQNEYEMGRYNLDEASVDTQRQRFELYKQEALQLLEKRLPIPAYDHLLKLSHVFNVLDARGAVGVTERQNCFATLRNLARTVTALFLARREELGHPLGIIPPPPQPSSARPDVSQLGTNAEDFVLEIGSEELPPDDAIAAMEQLRERVPALLARLRLQHGGVRVEATPRRLAVQVSGLASRQPDSEDKVRGPPAKVAFGADGLPSKALEGFCRKSGVAAADVTVEADAKGTEYVWAVVKSQGRPAPEVMAEELGPLVGDISFTKSMRWRGNAAYSRPLRWLLAIHGNAVVPFAYAGLRAGATTRVLRNSSQPELQVSSAAAYAGLLAGERITLGLEQRSAAIWEGVSAAAAEAGGSVAEAARSTLLPEVANLVESPTVLRGAFDPAFLALPREVLEMVMRKHQRYFPVYDASGELLPLFITVANGPVDPATVRRGNEAVLRARFQDAQFFYEEDLRTPLQELRPRLAGTLFQADLGSLLDKAQRSEALIQPLAAATGLTDHAATAQQAAHLAKADLASTIVTEMTALAGVMGRHYALRQGLQPAVAEAIFESVLPRNAGDALPASPAGILVAVADRLDSLVGLTAAGCGPSASADPYGLRRSAYAMLQTLVANNVSLDLRHAVALAAELQPLPVPQPTQAEVLEFVGRRLEQLLVEEGLGVEAVRAVLQARGHDPALAARSARQLQAEVEAGEAGRLQRVMAGLSRATRIVRGKSVAPDTSVSEALLEADEEKALYQAYQLVAAQVGPSSSIPQFLEACEQLIEAVDAFFDNVFVMTEDQAVRQNRLALLRDLAALPAGILELSELPGY